MAQSHPLVVTQLLFLLNAYLPRIGQAELCKDLKVEEVGDGEHCISIGNSGLGIDTGWLMQVPTLMGNVNRQGFRVFSTVIHPATRWHPSEQEDKTELQTLGMAKAVERVGVLLAQMAMEGLPDFPEALREAVEEAA